MWKARAIALCGLAACGGGTSSAPWQAVLSDQPTALLSAWANSPSDVYLVGGDARDGNGPVALHYDGTGWSHLATGVTNTDLWWTFGFADGTVFASGSGGTILKYSGGAFTKMTTPGEGTSVIVFGMWGAASDDVWAVGGTSGDNGGGFVWHYDGTSWTANADVDLSMTTVYKVSGRTTGDVWMVGAMGMTLHWNGASLDMTTVATDGSLLSVAAMSDRFIAVGGDFDGILYENVDGSSAGWQSALPAGGPSLNGVAASGDTAFAVGHTGAVLTRDSSGWSVEDTGGVTAENLHAAIIDSAGGKWAMGGNFDEPPTTHGVLIYQGSETIGGTVQ